MLTSKLSPISGNYQRIFNLDKEMEEELQELQPPTLKIKKTVVQASTLTVQKLKLNTEEIAGDPLSDEDDDDGNYVDMVRTALKDTRKIIGEVTHGSALWEQIHEIFNIFSGRLG